MANTRTLTVTIAGDETGAKRALNNTETAATKAGNTLTGVSGKVGGAFGKLDNLLASFGVPFSGVLGQIGSKLEQTESKATSTFGKIADAGKLAAIGIGVAFIGIAAVGIKQAQEEEVALARLRVAIKNTGESYSTYAGQIKKVQQASINLGYDDAEAAASLATLTTASGSVKIAFRDIAIAEDLARARHISLEAATAILAKVETGHVALLGRYGIATKDATGKTISQEEAIRRLTALVGGSATAYTKTFSGQIQVLKEQMLQLAEKVGTWLIPKIQALVGVISDAIKWFQQHKTVAEALGIVLGTVLVVAIGAYTIAMLQAAAATIAATWPVLAVIAVAAALVAGIYELWTNWDQIWTWMGNHPAFAVIIAVLGTILSGGLLLIIAGAIELAKNWDEVWSWIKQAASDAADFVVAVLQPIINTIDGIIGAARDAKHAIDSLTPGGGSSTDPLGIGHALGIPGYAKGGPVYAAAGFWAPRGTDTVPAMLTPGEFVVPKDGALVKGGNGNGNVDTLNIQFVLDGKVVGEATVDHINKRAQSGPVLVAGAVR